jgi:dihydroorotase-like cyclic amidohydrolase
MPISESCLPKELRAQKVTTILDLSQLKLKLSIELSQLLKTSNCPLYIVHLMSKESSEEVMRAKNRGLLVYTDKLWQLL